MLGIWSTLPRDAMEELRVAGAHVHTLDLRQPEAIDACVQQVLHNDGRVDLLVNNAGYGAYGAIEDVPIAEARAQMEVNLFACAALMQRVLPAMREQRRRRIINITSIGGKIWSPLGGWYHASKFALEGLSDCLRNEVRPFGIDVVVIEPGDVKTEWGGIAIQDMVKASGHGPYRPIAEASQAGHRVCLADVCAATGHCQSGFACRDRTAPSSAVCASCTSSNAGQGCSAAKVGWSSGRGKWHPLPFFQAMKPFRFGSAQMVLNRLRLHLHPRRAIRRMYAVS